MDLSISSLYIGLALSILLGAVIGAQREMKLQQKHKLDFAGFRTYTLISLLGFLLGFLGFGKFNQIFLVIVGVLGIFAFALVAYKQVSIRGEDVSIISEVSAVLTFIIGVIVSVQEYYLAIIITFILTFILSIGNELHSFAKKITTNEVFASLKFALISIIVLPILPNKDYSLYDMNIIRDILFNFGVSYEFMQKMNVFNPFEIWLMVVFVSGIAFVGYILMRTIGANKGSIITGFLGGLMSSTALTSSFSIESKRNHYLIYPLAVGVIIASSTMFFRILFEVFILNKNLLMDLIIPMSIMGVVGLGLAFYVFKFKNIDIKKSVEIKTPFALKPAFEFALFYILIVFLASAMLEIFGDSGVLIVAFLSGIADVDAITISLSTLSLQGELENNLAVLGIVIAAFSNTLVKAGIAYSVGAKKFAKIIFMVFGGIILSGILGLILF